VIRPLAVVQEREDMISTKMAKYTSFSSRSCLFTFGMLLPLLDMRRHVKKMHAYQITEHTPESQDEDEGTPWRESSEANDKATETLPS
jgi:hypothetical protein